MSINLHTYTTGPVATNSYIVVDEENHGLIIDAPPGCFEPMLRTIREMGIKPGGLVLTHTHWDHTADANRLREEFGEEMVIYVHEADEYRLKDPMKYLGFPVPIEMTPTVPDRYLVEGDTLTLGEMRFEILHTPGHTEGSICLYDSNRELLFSGDVIFAGSVGRTDFEGGDWDTLMNTITDKLMPLPDDVRILPGHGLMTTIGDERESNPYIVVE